MTVRRIALLRRVGIVGWTAAAIFTGTFIASAITTSASAADKLPSSITCLPENTVLISRVPDGAAVGKALKERTKLGAVLGDPQRIARLVKLLQSTDESQGKWDELVKELGRYNLRPDDYANLFTGEMGFAVAISPGWGMAPMAQVFGWIEPEEELSTRIVDAAMKASDENGDKVVRSDMELAGVDVMRLTTKNTEGDDETEDFLFLSQIGSRLFASFAVTSMQDAKEHANEIADRLQQGFGKFLDAHHRSAAEQPEILKTPGLSAALPSGIPLFEVFADPRPLVTWFLAMANKVEEPQRESAQRTVKLVKGLGLDTLGPLGWRMALDGNLLGAGIFASVPSPRSGIFSLVDQTPIAAEPPAWVSADVVSYEQFSFDLAKAYARIKSMVIELVGDQSRAGIDFIESQVTRTVQADPASLLGALGTRHIAIGLMPRTEAKPDDEGEMSTGRSGMVWEVKDETLLRRVMQIGATMTGQDPLEEQGFMGLRIQQPQFQGGVFLGRGFLVVGAGDSAIESLLSMLRSPPAGEASLTGSSIYRRACELLAPEACLTYQLTDNNRNMKAARQIVVNTLELIKKHQQAGDDDDDNELNSAFDKLNPEMIDKLLELLPSESELDGALGVGVSQMKANENGVVSRSVVELPAGR